MKKIDFETHFVTEGREDEIIHCDCRDACNKLVAADKPAACARWGRETLATWKAMLA